MEKLIRAEIDDDDGSIALEARGIDDVEFALSVALLLATLKENKHMPDGPFDKLLDIAMTGAKMDSKTLRVAFDTYLNSGIKEALKEEFTKNEGVN